MTLVWSNDILDAFHQDVELISALCGGLGILTVIGCIDDLKDVSAITKLLGQIAAGGVAYTAGIQIDAITIPFFGIWHLGMLSLPMTIFWYVLAINAVNLIDGMDGLAGSVVALSGTTLFLMGFVDDRFVSCLVLVAMLGGVTGFLRYNFNPASIFLGDTGSMSLGFILALTAVHSSQKSGAVFSVIAALLIIGLPIFDLSLAVFRRLLSGKKIFKADQYHIHHMLLRKGFNQRQSVFVLVGAAGLLEMLALVNLYSSDWISALSIVALVVALGLGVRMLGYRQVISFERRSSAIRELNVEAELRLHRVMDLAARLSHAQDSDHEGPSELSRRSSLETEPTSTQRLTDLSATKAALKSLAKELGWARIQIDLPNGQGHWLRSDSKAVSEGANIQGMLHWSISLPRIFETSDETTINDCIVAQFWVQEKECPFPAQERTMVLLLCTALQSYLSGVSIIELIQDADLAGPESSTESSATA